MSAIAAAFNLDGAPAERAVIERMLASAPYRGADGSGLWTRGPAAIGHAMLRTTPESIREIQPLTDEDERVCLAFDGRIDNRDELRAELERRGERPRDDTDAELVLRALMAWGDEAPRRLLGDFALAFHDSIRGRMFCARDPMGVKPLYYYAGARFFICASELHQLFADRRVMREPNEAMIGESLRAIRTNRVETLFRGISRLAPGELMAISARGIERRAFYDPDLAREIRYSSDGEYAEHYRALLTEAVRARMRSVGPMLADMSGGLDSTSVAGVALKLMREGRAAPAGFRTASLLSDDPGADEREYIREAERHYGIRTCPHAPPKFRFGAFEAQVRHYKDIPDYPNGAVGDYAALLGGIPGVRVWLTGVGGDDWLWVTPREYADLIRGFRAMAIINRMRRDGAERRRHPSAPHPLRLLAVGGVLPLMPAPIRSMVKRRLRGGARDLFPLTPDFARRIGLIDRIECAADGPKSSDRQWIYYCQHWQIHALEMCDRRGARHDVEFRHPFMDRRLMEFCFGIPADQRTRDGMDKFILRNAMRGILPPKVARRAGKAEFSFVMRQALAAADARRRFESLEIAKLGWVNGDAVLEAFAAVRAGRFDSPSPKWRVPNLWALWMAFAIELWFRINFMEARDAANSIADRPAGISAGA